MPTGYGYKTYEKAADGVYTVTGIAGWTTTERDAPDKPPIFVRSQWTGQLQVGIELATTSESANPVMYLTAGQFVAFVHMFGLTDFTPANVMTSAVLLEAKKLVNESGKTIRLISRGGYANGVVMPEGKYKVKFNGFGDNQPKTLKKNASPVLFAEFEVVTGVYAGFVFSVILNNSWNDTPPDGRPELVGEVNATRWDNLIKYFTPEAIKYEWKDAISSEFGVNEAACPWYVLTHLAQTGSHTAYVWYKHQPRQQGGTVFGTSELSTINEHNGTPPTPTTVVTSEQLQQQFADMIISKGIWEWEHSDDSGNTVSMSPAGADLFQTTSPITFSDTGKKWAAAFLGGENGFWAAAGLPADDHRIGELSADQLRALIDTVKSRYNL